MKYTRQIIVIMISCVLIACAATREKHNNIMKSEALNFQQKLRIAENDIKNHLEKNGLDTKGFKFIYRITGNFDGYDNPCDVFEDENQDGQIDRFKFATTWVEAFVIDSDMEYIAKSSSHTLISNPESLNAYPREKEMIKIAKEEDYIAYLQIMGCTRANASNL